MRYLIFIGLFLGSIHNVAGQNPQPPIIDYVTILASGQVEIHWFKVTPPNINGYFIRDFRGFNLNPDNNAGGFTIRGCAIFDTSKRTLRFDYPKVLIQKKDSTLKWYDYPPVTFTMNSFIGDTTNKNISTFSNMHRPIYLTHTIDTCTHTLKLIWTHYIGWGDKLDGYQVDSIGNGTNIGPMGNLTNDTTLIIRNFDFNKWLRFYISAKRKGYSFGSNSNIDSVFVKGSETPNFTADQATFAHNHNVEVNFTIDQSLGVRKYMVTKSLTPDTGYQVLHIISGYIDEKLTIKDSVSQTTYYRLELLNGCNNPIKFSNLATAIVPVITARNNEIQLQWSGYNDWPGGVKSYDIYRNDDPISIGSTTSQTSYSENINDLKGKQLSGNICYHVEAIAKIGSYRSKSAKVCIDLDLSVNIPEGFTPNGDGKNDVFLPTFAFQPTNYSFVVFNRYGFKVFESKNSDEGWNGILNNGKSAPDGVYVYFITYKSSSGKTFEKRGNISLIYP